MAGISDTIKNKYYKQGREGEALILEKICGFIYNVNILCYPQIIKVREKSVNIHTIQCGNFELPTVVLLHGYGGSSMGFFKIMNKLSQNFKVYAMDWPGMGLSDRWDFKLEQKNPQQVIDFFIEVFDEWRKALGLNQFMIVAHSFGGYIASHYYYRFPENVNQLILLSPMGGTKKQQQQQQQEIEEIVGGEDKNDKNASSSEGEEEEGGGVINWVAKYLSKNAKENRYTPQSVLDKWYIPKNFILKKVVFSSLKNLTTNEKEMFVKYFQSIFNIPSYDDSYIHDLVDYPSLDPEISLEEIFSSEEYQNRPDYLKRNICVLYGDNDFMDSQGFENLFDQQIITGKVIYLHNSSHGLMIDAPNQVLAIIKNPEKVYMYPYFDPTIFQNDTESNDEEILLNEENILVQ